MTRNQIRNWLAALAVFVVLVVAGVVWHIHSTRQAEARKVDGYVCAIQEDQGYEPWGCE